MKKYTETIYHKPTLMDALLLSFFAVAVTLQPFLFQRELNLSELNLYLPGINAILQGMVPYRDFFHLRGPLELYLPAGLMMIFGIQVSILTLYFYVGNVLTLIISIFIGKELIKTRYLFGLMSLVLIARTFPRVMFYCWGGMRYAFGLMAILAIIYFFKKRKQAWLILSGVFTVLGGLTSIEIGVCSFIAIIFALGYTYVIEKNKKCLQNILTYLISLGLIILPFCIYLFLAKALGPYVQSTYVVVTQMEKVIDLRLFSRIPKSFTEIISLMFSPLAKNFRHVTPAFLYAFLSAFVIHRHVKKKKIPKIYPGLVATGMYGFCLFATAFRNIWGAQLEMALQPEKILLFFLCEEAYFILRDRKILVGERLKAPHMFKKNIWVERFQYFGILFLFAGLLMSSLGYSYVRFNKRFIAWKVAKYRLTDKDVKELSPLNERLSRPLNLPRAAKVVVPLEQAHELEEIVYFIQENTGKEDKVFVYPEMGSYSFFFDRPFVHKYPLATFSWLQDKWHNDFIEAVRRDKPVYAILPKEIDVISWRDYFANPKNKQKYDEVMKIIDEDYLRVKETEKSIIYRKSERQE